MQNPRTRPNPGKKSGEFDLRREEFEKSIDDIEGLSEPIAQIRRRIRSYSEREMFEGEVTGEHSTVSRKEKDE